MGGSVFSCSSLLCAAVLAYFGFALFQLYKLAHPLYGIQPSDYLDEPVLSPLWQHHHRFDVRCFISTTNRLRDIKLNKSAEALASKSNSRTFHSLFDIDGISLEELSQPVEKHFTLYPHHSLPKGEFNLGLPAKIWNSLETNGSTVFLHVYVIREDVDADSFSKARQSGKILWSVVPLIKIDKLPPNSHTRYLLEDVPIVRDLMGLKTQDSYLSQLPRGALISYWKPIVASRIVNEQLRFPQHVLPSALFQHLVTSRHARVHPNGQSYAHSQSRYLIFEGSKVWGYMPPLHTDEMGLTSDKYVPLNASLTHLPFTFTLYSMSFSRWLLMQQMEESLGAQKGLGFTDKEIDDVRRLISDTNVYLLAITLLASILHLIFEFLAVRSDVSFWQNNTSLTGLSARSVVIELVFQGVIFMYLLEQDTSLLVTVPSFVALCIQCWKVYKATGLQVSFQSGLPRVEFPRWKAPPQPSRTDNKGKQSEDEESIRMRVTLEVDRVAVGHLSTVLLPVCLGFALRNLVFEQHSSWYSWGVGAMTGSVYTFGFILMTPQLFINYRLRSVAHLPWKFLCYKFINTFIDDLFAFVIKMPTMHRLSVFRDDVVFLIYLYQRWIYPVDASRPIDT